MMMRNALVYRLATDWSMTVEQLEEQLAKKPFQLCGKQDPKSAGWVSPTGNGMLAHSVGGQWLIALCVETKMLPSSVVKQEAQERADKLFDERGYKVGRKEMKELRERVTEELMPRAFSRRKTTFAWLDPKNGWLVVDAASAARAEDVLEMLRHTLDELPVKLVRTERSPASAMSSWLAEGEGPVGFTVDQDCELRSVSEDKAAVRYVRHSLDNEEVKGHLTAGKLPTRLAMTYDDRVSFVLTEKCELKRISLLDVVKESLEAEEGADAEALFNASFALVTGELSRLLPALVDGLGGELPEA